MKHLFKIVLFSFLSISYSFSTTSVDSTGLLGDGFSLEGAIEVLKSSESLEDFEINLNREDNYVNNLDLNDDGEIDYIRVVDNMESDVHAIVLQALISNTESQDIAVIQIEKTGKKNALLQIIGDELLYGKDMIVEPYETSGVSTGESGPSPEYHIERIVINVWSWPVVSYIYTPRYRVYHSPYHWNHYPRRWKPWRPHPFRIHYNHRKHYRHNHRVVHVHRTTRAHKIYTPRRKTSVIVHKRSKVRVNKKGNKIRKTNTVKINKKGKKTKVKRTTVSNKKHKVTKTTKVKKKGNKKIKKTTIKHKRR